jgi:phospholipid/cholesterol/gamma-HCH transport system ATP-binding protein
MNGDDVIIRVKDLRIGYGDRVILENINFEVRRGEVLVIIGRSGSGKSTLLKNIIGLYEPMAGDVSIFGKSLLATTGEDRRKLLQSFGVLYQSGALFGSMSVLENVRLPLDEFTNLPLEARNLIALGKLKLVGLANIPSAMPSSLSGGMQKRAALARAMALDPKILFLDEPSVGLDPVTSASLDQLILKLAKGFGITFVIVTHEMESIYDIATRAIMVDDRARTIIAEGKPSDLRDKSSDPRVRNFFQRQPEEEAHQLQSA